MLDCREPSSWPVPPVDMTFSALKSIESCPRQWALQAADYGKLWSRKGYPPRIAIKALLGTIAHAIVEKLTRELVAARCSGISDAAAIGVMRSLGGYTGLITRAIESTLAACRENPRAANMLDHIERNLRSRGPEIRAHVQSLLSHVRFGNKPVYRAKGSEVQGRHPLQLGLYPEVFLKAADIQWKGKIDLLALETADCEITEFKTGKEDASHREQVRMYSVLWWMDGERNPSKRPATKLTLVYPAGNEDVPCPSKEDLAGLAEEMTRRGNSAKRMVATMPPAARPNADICRPCGVRQLCSAYWDAPPTAAAPSDGKRLGDVQAIVRGRHGATSWDAVAEVSSGLPVQARILIRSVASGTELHGGQRIRVLDAWFSDDPEFNDSTKVVTLWAQSEVYRLE